MEETASSPLRPKRYVWRKKTFAKNGLLSSSLMSSWQIWPFIFFCSTAEGNQGSWAQPQDSPPPPRLMRERCHTITVLFGRVGLLFVKRRGPQQMLCSTILLDPDALMFQRWPRVRDLHHTSSLTAGRGPAWPRSVPCQDTQSQPPLLLHQNGIDFFFHWEARIFTRPSMKSASLRRNFLLAPAYA